MPANPHDTIKKPQALIIALILSMMFLITHTYSIPILVSISGTLEGSFILTNNTIIDYDAGYSIFHSTWENVGSVGCDVALRMDIYSGKNLMFTSWSRQHVVAPGAAANFINYWYFGNLSGNFTIRPRVYFCDEIEELTPFNISIKEHNLTYEVKPLKVESWVYDDDRKKIHFRAELNTSPSKLLFIPRRVPLGTRVAGSELFITEKGQEEFTIPWKFGYFTEYRIPAVLISNTERTIYYVELDTWTKQKSFLRRIMDLLKLIF